MKTSESIKQLAQSLIKVQGEIKGMRPDASNPFFKSSYITLDGMLEYVRPILTKNGIIALQNVSSCGEYAEVITRLLHVSGEYMETDSLKIKPTKNDPQQHGSAITYAKRYQLGALLGISTEVDDDGNKATHSDGKKSKQAQGQVAGQIGNEKITRDQVKRMYEISGEDSNLCQRVIQKYGYQKSTEVLKKDYEKICTEIENERTRQVMN